MGVQTADLYDNLLNVSWRPTAEAGALTVLERCASPLDAAYLLGVAYYLEQAGKVPILLQLHAVEGQAGIWFTNPWPGWKLPRRTPVQAPPAMLIVPQYNHLGQRYTFGVCYGKDSDDPRWRLEYLVQLSPPRTLTIEGRQQRFKSPGSAPLTWWKAVVLIEVALA